MKLKIMLLCARINSYFRTMGRAILQTIITGITGISQAWI